MKLNKFSNLPLSIVLLSLILCSCGDRNSRTTGSIEYEDSESFLETDMGETIDYYAGHPNDPDLPQYIIGATDEVIEATNPRELVDLMEQGIDFAQTEVEREPRYLFALGRVAYLLGYKQDAREWLELSASNGSAAANAYLGYILFYEDEDTEQALVRFRNAIDGNFQDGQLLEVYTACNFDPAKSRFNRKYIITALYYDDMDYLKKKGEASVYVIKIHNALWSNEILWLVDDPEILMELDPEVSQTSGSILDEFGIKFASTLSNAAQSAYIQDAKRLALLYNSNPLAFRKIYSGIRKFAKSKR